MAWGTFTFRSMALNMPVEAEVLIPQSGYKSLHQKENYKVIILLHGVRNDRTEWLLKSQIFEMVKELPVLVFMPSAKNSFYVNTYTGYKYMDYISNEIPEFIKTHFRVSDKREDWLIAGSSMGGYGALACGLNHTETFGNIASFSGAVDITDDVLQIPEFNMKQLFGQGYKDLSDSNYNLFYLYDRIEEKERPRVFMCCGDSDFLRPMNERFYEKIKDLYDVIVNWGEGDHDFIYWNEQLKNMFKWFCPDEIRNGYFMGRRGNDLC